MWVLGLKGLIMVIGLSGVQLVCNHMSAEHIRTGIFNLISSSMRFAFMTNYINFKSTVI